jgi:hypothetical protein
MNIKLNVKVLRKAKVSTHPFTDYFKGFENVKAIRAIFGSKTEKILQNLKVEFYGRQGYMGVSNKDGHLIISANYMNNGEFIDIYLDIIHELTHVKQFMDGKELFDNHYKYIERPTEIEAFHNAVLEARRLGLDEDRICEYLKTEWMTYEELLKLATTLQVKCGERAF